MLPLLAFNITPWQRLCFGFSWVRILINRDLRYLINTPEKARVCLGPYRIAQIPAKVNKRFQAMSAQSESLILFFGLFIRFVELIRMFSEAAWRPLKHRSQELKAGLHLQSDLPVILHPDRSAFYPRFIQNLDALLQGAQSVVVTGEGHMLSSTEHGCNVIAKTAKGIFEAMSKH